MDTIKYLLKKFRVHGKGPLPPYHGKNRKSCREDIYDAFADLGFKIGAEIGVKRGRNALQICKRVPGLKLICVDPWKPYTNIMTSERMKRYYETAKKNLKDFDITWMEMTSMEAAKKIGNKNLDFIYIDAIHTFDHVMMDLIRWCPKVRVGGIIYGHDSNPLQGVRKAVNAYTFAHGIRHVHVTRDIPTSFFWAKDV